METYLIYLTIALYTAGLLSTLVWKDGKGSWFLPLFLGAWALHTSLLILRAMATGHAPMAGRYETLLFFGWSIGLLNLILLYRYHFRTVEGLNTSIILLTLVLAAYSDRTVYPLPLVLKTRWFETHVVTSFFSYALFTVAATSGAMYLIKYGREELSRLRTFQEIIYRSTLWGFIFFSLSMTLGAIWAYLAWGRYWLWEAKTISSMLLWLYFAGLIHTRFLKEWRGRKVAVMAVAGLGVVLFTYLGVSLFLKSSHSM